MVLFENARRRLASLVAGLYPHAQARTNKHGGTDYYIGDQYLCGLRPGKTGVTLYLMPLYVSKKIDFDFADRLKAWRSGKSCLKFTESKPMDWALVEEVLVANRGA